MIDHVSLGVGDLARARAFYDAVLAPFDNGAPGLRPHYHAHYYVCHDPE